VTTERILRVRVRSEETLRLWKHMLSIYRSEGKRAEQLLYDALLALKVARYGYEIY